MLRVVTSHLPRQITRTSHFAAARVGSSTQTSIETGFEPSTVYANPICLQMDQRILAAVTPEEILTVLVTHRGALFVHNLVTSLVSLSHMARQSVPFSRAKELRNPDLYEKTERDKMLSDPRYDLLIRDLIDYSQQLDLKSIQTILLSLERLDHCQYKLVGALLKRIYSMDITADQISTIVSIGQSLEWAGFAKAESFYTKLALVVETECQEMSKRDFLNSLVLYSKLDRLHAGAMAALAKQIPSRLADMSAREMGIAAIGVSEFGSAVGGSPEAVDGIATRMLSLEQFPVREMIRTAVSLRRVNVANREFLSAALRTITHQLEEAQSMRERMESSVANIADVSQLFYSAAYFGIGDPRDISTILLPYIQDNFDVVTEESAIRFLFTVSMFPECVTATTGPLISLLIRKIASATDSWEKHKSLIISVFFSKCMQFSFIDSEFRKLVIDSSLSHYLTARRGYGVPYPETSHGLFSALKEAASDTAVEMQFNAWIPNSPYNADILIPKDRTAILVLSRFGSDGKIVGTDLLQAKQIESLGWRVIALDRKQLMELQQAVIHSILAQIVS